MRELTADLLGPLPARPAEEVALLLAAEGVEVTLALVPTGTLVRVAPADLERALGIIAEEYPDGLDTAARRHGDAPPAPAPPDRDVPARWFGRGSWLVIALAAACWGVFIAEETAGGSQSRDTLLRFGASRPAHVRTGEWWRLVTALFLHIGPRHLLANVATLLVLGPALTAALGAGRFALVYVLAGAAGNALSYLLTPPDVVSAGASGAILGVLGALGGQRLRFAASARYRGWQVLAALLAYLAIAVGAEPGVDTMAHLGGLAAGLGLGLVVPPLAREPTAHDRRLSLACGVAALALVVAAYAALLAAR